MGIQLEIGARGLSPHRTSNFNTWQNGYDISADALGYRILLYAPSEAIKNIEIVRVSSFIWNIAGGLLNFNLKKV